jgi:hypothetical protein
MLWRSNNSHRVYGWLQILNEWNATLEQAPYVETVIENIRAATNQAGDHSPRLSQFLTYVNYEQDAMKWLLYEFIAIRWLWGSIRLDYVRGVLDEIDSLDSYFPAFPGSPSCTLRQFVQSNLDEEELEYVQMMPALVPMTPLRSSTYSAPPALRRRSSTRAAADNSPIYPTLSERFAASASSAPATQAPSAHSAKCIPPIMIRVIRSMEAKDSDDVIKITPKKATGENGEKLFTITYNDQDSSVNTKMKKMDEAAVMQYLSNFLRLLSVDEEPFESVQFTFPTLPTVLVTPKNLTSQTRELVYETVETMVANWPVWA